jgi:PAS domain-containing protein
VIEGNDGRPLEIVGSWADISARKQAELALGERMALMNDLETLVGASPAIIYTTQVSGDYACTFVSENSNSIMGYAPGRCATTRNSGSSAFTPKTRREFLVKWIT